MASSLILRALYRPGTAGDGELDLVLTGGRRYVYSNVPMAVAEGFRAADSKGSFYNRHIRNLFPCREVAARRIRPRAPGVLAEPAGE